ncbi:MAG: alpha-glucosidase/alpha-galactosidase [Clostridia bacterium]|nr:alpha-glucosidase/alpha-galactosidase [Clostridia bacterium]
MNDLKNLKITYIGGGSRGWAKNFMNDFALEPELAGSVYLYDIDKQAAEYNAIIGNALSAREDVVGKWNYVAEHDLAKALDGADFVVISILPGTFDEMESDVHTPEKYGIYQSVGDTTGAGGLVRALRSVPIFYNYAKAIEKYCPNAWVINFTNPMAMCVAALYKGFPKIKAFGCCHEVFATQTILGKVIKEQLGEDASRDDIRINVFGVNHFTWIDKASYKGKDLLPMYDKFIDAHPEGIGRDGNWANNGFQTKQLVKFELFKRYGIIAAAGDRHLAEFCPADWYLSSPERVEEMGFGLTTVAWRKQQEVYRVQQQEKRAKEGEPFKFYNTDEETVRQIKALCGLHSFITNVNVPNVGQIENLPLGCVVETNAQFSSDYVSPVFAGKIPPAVNALVSRVALNQEAIVEAAITGDYELAFQAFANDQGVQLPLDKARELFNEMLYNTRKYLPYYEQYAKTQK